MPDAPLTAEILIGLKKIKIFFFDKKHLAMYIILTYLAFHIGHLTMDREYETFLNRHQTLTKGPQ